MPHRRNASLVTFRLLRGGPVRLSFRPLVHFRPQSDPVADFQGPVSYTAVDHGGGWEIRGGDDVLRLRLDGARADFRHSPRVEQEVAYPEEAERGYHSTGRTVGAGNDRGGITRRRGGHADRFGGGMGPGRGPSTGRRAAGGTAPPRAVARGGRSGRAGRSAGTLVLAADEFLITPPAPRRRARTPDGDRGLLLVQRVGPRHDDQPRRADARHRPARRGRLHPPHVRRLHPQRPDPQPVPRGRRPGLYNTADASLWFFPAIDRYVESDRRPRDAAALLPRLRDIVGHHLEGTEFRIGVDPPTGCWPRASRTAS